MTGDWETGTLGDIADLIMGQSPTGETCNENGNGTPLLNGPTEFGGNHPRPVQFTTDPRKFAEPGDLLFCVRGSTTGRMNWADQRYAIGRGLAAIRPKHGNEFRHFVRAVIDTNLPRLLASATGSTFPNVSRDQIQEIECSLPPLAEQKAIASVLGALDDKIELNRRMNATLEAMARALFQSWFVDFDPVRVKLDGRQPTSLDPATAALFPAVFQDSEVGRIPAGWTVRSLGEVIDLGSGVPYEAKFKGDSGLPMITLGCVSFHDRFQEKGLTHYNGDFKETHVVKPDDLVLASHDVTQERKQLGSPAMVPRWLKDPTILAATNLYIVRNKSAFPNQFLYQLFRADGFRQQMVASAKGTAILFISKYSILRHRLAWPTEELAARFSTQAEALYSQYSTNAAQSRTLATLRDTLLPKLLSGELSVI